MAKSEPSSTPNDSTKLAIRDEVEKRFEKPPKTFVDLIEAEVEKRVELRVKNYTLWIKICGGIIVLFLTIIGFFWTETTRSYIDSKLSQDKIDQSLLQASNTLDKIVYADTASENNSLRILSMLNRSEIFLNSISNRDFEIKQQDNVLLQSDFPKFFVSENFTNLIGTRKIILKHEPIPDTLKFYDGPSQFSLYGVYSLEGNVIDFTNENMAPLGSPSGIKYIHVEYVSKSLK